MDLLAVQGNLKSLCFCLSVKLLISLSNPNESLARQSVLGCRLFSFITLWKIDGATMETVRGFIFLDSKITADGDCTKLKDACSLEEKL